uniref:peptidase C1 n=1 Tax=Chamaesiphon sp. VAR_48_metabat_403 TaxID=2964700 RepID=UPI0037C0563C
AIAEVGILYATATVHEGWNQITTAGSIPLTAKILGGHAFAIVAYDDRGFWIQNSWGKEWGLNGFACISYDDWLINGNDIWVCRLGAAVELNRNLPTAISHSAAANNPLVLSFADLRPHIISLGNDGLLKAGGDFGTSPEDIESIFQTDFPRITQGWTKKRILLYAHGGLVDENSAVQRLADYRATLLDLKIYPISFIWHSDFWTTLTNILGESLRRRRPEGILDDAKDFLLDRLDDALEPLVRGPGRVMWNEMKENAIGATANPSGGARLAIEQLVKLVRDEDVEIHVVGHSAGAIFHAPIVELLTTKGKIASGHLKGLAGYNLPIESCTLWAPACNIDLFDRYYQPAIDSKQIDRFTLFTLTDTAEQDDNCAAIYNKSLLYLISNAFESQPRIPLARDGEPILGMEKFIKNHQSFQQLLAADRLDWILSPNHEAAGSAQASRSEKHGAFDDDNATVAATVARILNTDAAQVEFNFMRSASSLRSRRKRLS